MSILQLPNELLQSIFTYYTLLFYSPKTLQLVCRRWNAVAQATPVLKSRIIYLSHRHLASTLFQPQFLARCASSLQTTREIEHQMGGWYEFTYDALGMSPEEVEHAPLSIPEPGPPTFTTWKTFSTQCTKLHIHLYQQPVRWLHHLPFFYALTHLEISNPFNGVITAMLARVNLERGCPLVSLTVVGTKNNEILAFGDTLGVLKRVHVETQKRSRCVPLDKLLPLLVRVEAFTWRVPQGSEPSRLDMMGNLPVQSLVPCLRTLDAPGQVVGRLPQSILDRLTHLELRSPSLTLPRAEVGVCILFPQVVHLTLYGLWLDMLFMDAPRLRELVLKDSMGDVFYDQTYTLTRFRPKILRMVSLRSIRTLLMFIDNNNALDPELDDGEGEGEGGGEEAPFGGIRELYVDLVTPSGVEKAFIPAFGRTTPSVMLRKLKHLVLIPPVGRDDLSAQWRLKLRKAVKKRVESGVKNLRTIRCT